MVVVLPSQFPTGPYCRQDELQRAYVAFAPATWLHDEAVDLVHSNFMCSNGSLLPPEAYVVHARTSTLIALGGRQAVESAKMGCDLGARKWILVPINDSTTGSADSGSHWTVLMGMKDEQGYRWTCLHLDSGPRGNDMRGPSAQKAIVVASRLFGRNTEVCAVKCASQDNGFDCGVFALHFIHVILNAFVASQSFDGFRRATAWRRQIESARPGRIARFRAVLRSKCVVKQAGLDKPISVDDRDDDCRECGSTLTAGSKCFNPSCSLAAADVDQSKGVSGQPLRKKPANSESLGEVGSTDQRKNTRSPAVPKARRGSSAPCSWSSPYSLTLGGDAKKAGGGKVFRKIHQDSYSTICKYTEARSEKAARQYGFLPGMPPTVTRICFACDSEMALESWKGRDSVLRCSNWKCRKSFNGKTALNAMFGSIYGIRLSGDTNLYYFYYLYVDNFSSFV